jgi:hypothetical protein
MQIYVDGTSYANYARVSGLPAGTTISVASPGTHRVTVRAYDTKTLAWVKPVVYVTSPQGLRDREVNSKTLVAGDRSARPGQLRA